MKLIIGLGNPGNNYRLTKHNFGFWVINQLVEQSSLTYKAGKGDYVFAMDNNCLFVKPTTFVNNSGIAIKQVINYYKIKNIKDVLVVYDDINIDLGKIRFRSQGSDGGHNGLNSIIEQLGSRNFWRLRIGIDKPDDKNKVIEYVLGKPSKEDKESIFESIHFTINEIDNFFLGNGSVLMNKLNGDNK